MSRYFTLLFFSILSFAIGVWSSPYFFSSTVENSSRETFKHRDAKEIKKEEKKELRGESESAFTSNSSQVEKISKNEKQVEHSSEQFSSKQRSKAFPEWEELNSAQEKIENFYSESSENLSKNFAREDFTKDERSQKSKVLATQVRQLIKQKNSHYKMEIDLNSGEDKLFLFLSYMECNHSSKEPCYQVKLLSRYREKWSNVSISSETSGAIWKDNVAFFHISLIHINALVSDLGYTMLALPIPGSDALPAWQIYKNDEFSWEDVHAKSWRASTLTEEQEMEEKVLSYMSKK